MYFTSIILNAISALMNFSKFSNFEQQVVPSIDFLVIEEVSLIKN